MTKGGPVTERGKGIARWNAARHGIRSPAPVVPGIEKAEDWEEHSAGVLESLDPQGHLETVLAERIALLLWRLYRVTRYERETITLIQEKAEEDLAQIRAFSPDSGPSDPQIVRGNLKSAQADYRLLKRFPKMADDKPLSLSDADCILWTVAEYVEKAAPEELLESLSLSGIPDDTPLDEFDGWTAALVRQGIEAIAQSAGEDPEVLLDAATESLRHTVEQAKTTAEEVERDLERMSQERLLPDEKTLEKISRYEAHLSRQLYKAMHELEALQTKRAGSAAPLARLDVDGMEG